jgi:hypothetical protein
MNARIPVDIETITLKAMSKDAVSRYATAAQMADDLRRFIEHRPIHARRPSIANRAVKWARRHVALISIASAAITLAAKSFLVATLLTMRAYRSETRQRAEAVANLQIASDSIDRMLSRLAGQRFFQGDLGQAEMLASDAPSSMKSCSGTATIPESASGPPRPMEKLATFGSCSKNTSAPQSLTSGRASCSSD